MTDRTELINDFQEYANSLSSGYLKTWKANGIICTLTDKRLPIMEDNVRLLAYLTNCLAMEGFRNADIEKIQRWVIEKVA